MPESSEARLPFPRPILRTTRAARRPRPLRRLRRASARHPEWWMMPAAAAAWVWMWMAMRPVAHAGHGSHHGDGASAFGTRAMLAAMVIAMMLPLATGQVRRVARCSRWNRRHAASAAFLAAYLGLWMLAMAGIDIAWRAAASTGGWTAAMGVSIVAAAWEITPAKRRFLEACDAAVPVAPGGGRAYAHGAVHGVREGARCVGSCWALMTACVAFAHSLPVMAVLFGAQLIGRYWRGLPPLVPALAVAGVCLASLLVAAATHPVP